MEEQQKLDEILQEIEVIKLRLEKLEAQAAPIRQNDTSAPTTEPNHLAPSGYQAPGKSHPTAAGKTKAPFLKEGWESLIGKNLLNRAGVIVLLFAVAYFLKYSFDNNWIGPLGRVAIGFTTGIGFLIIGDLLMKRGYRYFAQGLSGGGIAIIYLSTFAAVNLYHLLSSPAAFVILALTAATGGLLAVRQEAMGLAFVATLGGFMAPFLIGSRSGNLPALLTYIAILDLAVLFLAYYKNWRIMNALAFVSTIIVYISYHAASYGISSEYIWTRQVFLVIYWLIFSSLSFLYNIRKGLPSRAGETALTLGNGLFFFTASYINLTHRYDDQYLAWLAVLLALIYLLISRWLISRNASDRLLYSTFMASGLAFLTTAIPLYFQQNWVETAWLVEAIILVYAGFRMENRMVQIGGLGLLFLGALITSGSFPWYFEEARRIPVFNVFSLNAYLSIAGLSLAAHHFFTRPFFVKIRPLPGWLSALASVFLALYYLSWEVENALNFYQLDFSSSFALSLTWVLLAVMLILGGLLKDNKVLRFLALGLFILTTLKVMLLDLSYMPIVLRIIILTVVGIILVAVSFAYQRAEVRKKEDDAQ